MSHDPEFYRTHMFDAAFDAWRLIKTGHRVINGDGSPAIQTRELALRHPFLAMLELPHRYIARRFTIQTGEK